MKKVIILFLFAYVIIACNSNSTKPNPDTSLSDSVDTADDVYRGDNSVSSVDTVVVE